MTRGCARVVIVAVLLGTPARGLAQTAAGSIAGVVRDTTGAVLPGVTVEASSPALIEKVRVAQTDAEGRYLFEGMPTGAFVVSAALTTQDRGSAGRAAAGGETVSGVDILIALGTAAEFGTVAGVVRYPGGEPAADAVVSALVGVELVTFETLLLERFLALAQRAFALALAALGPVLLGQLLLG